MEMDFLPKLSTQNKGGLCVEIGFWCLNRLDLHYFSWWNYLQIMRIDLAIGGSVKENLHMTNCETHVQTMEHFINFKRPLLSIWERMFVSMAMVKQESSG